MEPTQTSTLVVAALSFCASVVMIARVLRRHRLSLESGKDPLEPHRFTRRRVVMGLTLAGVAVMLFLGEYVFYEDFKTSPRAFAWFWLAVLGVLAGLLVLAAMDFFAVLTARIDFRRLQGPPKGD